MKNLLAIVLSLIALFTRCSSSDDSPINNSFIDHIEIVAHRGGSEYAPENSLKAISIAMDLGIQNVEVDIQLSRDNKLMVFHDLELKRMTDLPGTINDYDGEDLKSACLRDKAGIFTDETIPSLQDIFENIGNKINYYIDIKYPSLEIESKLVEMIKMFDLEQNITVLSFENACLKRLSESGLDIKLKLLTYDIDASPIAFVKREDYSHLDGVVLHYGLAEQHILSRLTWVKEIGVYTLNDVGQMKKSSYKYIDFIITDVPDVWLKLKKI